jgi:hypothetical protein
MGDPNDLRDIGMIERQLLAVGMGVINSENAEQRPLP